MLVSDDELEPTIRKLTDYYKQSGNYVAIRIQDNFQNIRNRPDQNKNLIEAEQFET
jgi:hypothetical protein